MKKILSIIAMLALGTIVARAQDLNGIDVGTPMPKSTVKSLFGQWEYIEEESLMITYMYNDNNDELVTYDEDKKLVSLFGLFIALNSFHVNEAEFLL